MLIMARGALIKAVEEGRDVTWGRELVTCLEEDEGGDGGDGDGDGILGRRTEREEEKEKG